MGEVSTRVWLDERLWQEVTNRALSERTTVRELIPELVSRSLTADPATSEPALRTGPGAAPSIESLAGENGPPVMALSDVYRCGVCGMEIRLGGVSQHMNKHKKEREAAEAERS
jgi:hypothetical protein